jgi:hypothetical protein
MRGPITALIERWRYLDIRIPASRDVTIRIVERPGRWMDKAACDALLADMRTVVASTLADGLEYGVLSGDSERLRQAVVTILYDKASGRPIAFNALTVMPLELRGQTIEAIHLGLVMVDPGFRTQGLSWVLYGLTCIMMFFRRGLRPLWISNVTQVPAIIGKVAEAFGSAWPNPFAEERRSFDHLCVAREIMAGQRHVFGVGVEAGFDEDRFVITNAYTGGSDNLKKTFEQAPKHRDPRPNALCEKELDYGRGDDFLQIARLDMPSVRAFLLREVPPASLPAVLYQVAFMVTAHMLLPVLHWLNPREPMGELRARTRKA